MTLPLAAASDYQYEEVPAALGMGMLIFILVGALLMVASLWKIFTKAGQPGWAAIVPIYNMIVMLKVAGKPTWWVLLFFIPLVSLIMSILVTLALVGKFGKGAGYAVGIILLPIIFLPMLAFGDAKYQDGPPPLN